MGRTRDKESPSGTTFFSFEMEKDFAEEFDKAVSEAKVTKRRYVLLALQEKMARTAGGDFSSVLKPTVSIEKFKELEASFKDLEDKYTDLKRTTETLMLRMLELGSDVRDLQKKS